MTSANVVYVPQSASATNVAYKLRDAAIGVVHEGVNNYDDNVGWTTSTGYNANTSTTMTITDNTHPVTSGLSTGTISIYTSSSGSYGSQINGTLASGAQTLGTNLGINSGNPNLVVLDFEATLANTYNSNSTANGRRVRLPFGGFGTLSWSNLTSDSLTMIQNALNWASQIAPVEAELYVSTTGGATFGGLTVEDEDFAFYDPNTSTASMTFEGDNIFVSDEDVDAFHVQSDGTYLISTTDSATIGSLTFEDEDVVEYDPNTGTATMFFDGSAVFSGDEDLGAVSVLSNGNIVLSTKGSATIGALTFGDEDLVVYDPGTGVATLLLDGSAVITDDSGSDLDISGVHVDTSGYIYLAMANDSTIGGQSFGNDDVVRYDPNTGTAVVVFDGESIFSDAGEVIDGLSLPPTNTGLIAHWKFDETSGTTGCRLFGQRS